MKTTLVIIGVLFLMLTVATGNELRRNKTFTAGIWILTLKLATTTFKTIQRLSAALHVSLHSQSITRTVSMVLVWTPSMRDMPCILCGDAATVVATLFAITPAVVVAVTTPLN